MRPRVVASPKVAAEAIEAGLAATPFGPSMLAAMFRDACGRRPSSRDINMLLVRVANGEGEELTSDCDSFDARNLGVLDIRQVLTGDDAVKYLVDPALREQRDTFEFQLLARNPVVDALRDGAASSKVKDSRMSSSNPRGRRRPGFRRRQTVFAAAMNSWR